MAAESRSFTVRILINLHTMKQKTKKSAQRTAIIYRLNPGEEPDPNLYYNVVQVLGPTGLPVDDFLIRAEHFKGGLLHALDAAKPRKNEVLVNTIPLN